MLLWHQYTHPLLWIMLLPLQRSLDTLMWIFWSQCHQPCRHLYTHLTQFGCHQTLDKLSKCLSNIARSISLLSNYIFQDARENDLLHQLLIRPRAYHNTHQTANSRNIWYLFHYFLFFLICRALCRAEFKVAREWSVEWLTLSYVKSLKNFLNIFS